MSAPRDTTIRTRPVPNGAFASAARSVGAARSSAQDRPSAREMRSRLQPLLSRLGITRCADVTGLDRLGIPTFCAIRPLGRTLQVSNGKGLDPDTAFVSAVMEASELHHMERLDPPDVVRASTAAMRSSGAELRSPAALSEPLQYACDDRVVIEWIPGATAAGHEPIFVPAGAVYLRDQITNRVSTNGLACGSSFAGAALHALYELIERDAVSRLVGEHGRLQVRRRCPAVALDSITSPRVSALIERIRAADVSPVLLTVSSVVPVHTFWAVLLDRRQLSGIATLTMGYCTRRRAEDAAVGAITEAAQSRLSLIHGAREDLAARPLFASSASDVHRHPAYRLFDDAPEEVEWSTLDDPCRQGEPETDSQTLGRLYGQVTRQTGDPPVLVDLTDRSLGIATVKVLAPGLRFVPRLF
jgi:ribosomal protein S12 methylthiotransferase accessory factor